MTVDAEQRGPIYAERIGSFLFITLNQPQARNPLTPDVVLEMSRQLDLAQVDADIRGVVLRGAGGTFSSGGNLGKFEARLTAPPAADGSDPIAVNNRRFGTFLQRLLVYPKPVVAVVQGAAIGGGVGLACVADVVLCSAEAKFALTETSLGLIPAQVLPFVMFRVGAANARRLMLTGERITAQEAWHLGLADIVVPDVDALRARLATLLDGIGRCAPKADAVTKALIHRWQSSPQDAESLSSLLDDAALAFAQQMRSEDFEGVRAAREKRPAPWTTTLNEAHKALLVLEGRKP